MRPYEILEHTGDVKIMVFGKTKQELFLNAMRGMMAILKSKVKNQKSKVRGITIKSCDMSALLVDFLSEVNYLAQTNREMYTNAKFIKFSETQLETELEGKKVKEFGEEIKAVTYHGLEIRQTLEGGWRTTVIFDV